MTLEQKTVEMKLTSFQPFFVHGGYDGMSSGDEFERIFTTKIVPVNVDTVRKPIWFTKA